MDTGVYQVAHTLIGALTAALASTRAGAPCISMVHPGTMTPDYGWCDCDTGEGMAWTRVVSITPTELFPAALSKPVTPGHVVQLAAVIELGVDRCYWNTDDNSMPAVAILDSLARDVIDDAAAMMRAAQCAGLGDVILGPWLPRGPQGGIHGGTMTCTVRVDTCVGCATVAPPIDTKIPPISGDPRT